MDNETNSGVTLTATPTDVDQGSNIFVLSYLTRKHGPAKSDVFFEYGPEMEASASDLAEGSFNGIGDNMRWSEIFWKFSIEGNNYLFQAPLNSPKMSLANSGSLIAPPSPTVTKLPDGSVLTVEDLKGLKSYPFQDLGTLRDAKELARDGQVVFIDSSDKSGQDHLSTAIVTHLKTSTNVKHMFGGMGPEFMVQKSLMFAGPGNQILKWPDGTPDTAISKRVAALLEKKDTEKVPDTESKFEPIDNDVNKRFADEDGLNSVPSKGDLRKTKQLDDTLKSIHKTTEALGLNPKSANGIDMLQSFHAKRSAWLEKESKKD